MAFEELIGTDIGLLSLFTIGFVVVMAVYLGRFVKKHMEHDERMHRH
ncbi:MAG: DUF3149 domain-containing protein [Zoogloeaceae bacterium]|nr:DUF3149 domain-containing protein [Rhodocyclaceae bacterium]MCP5236361.1 DUF3149 domain-containing protein [Zoogloeaceae bacterium]